MKKSFAVLALLLSSATLLKAQTQVLFKMKVTPNRTYAMLMNMNMDMQMDVEGDTASINQLKKAGQSFPIVMKMSTGTNADIKTSALNAANKIPFKMVLKTQPTKMSMNGADTPIPVPVTNETMYGTYSPAGAMELDSISGKAMDATLKANMGKLMEGIQASVKFPDKPMKVGDTFTQETPMDVPVAGMAMKMNNKITYKLTSIANGKAYFDLLYNMVLDMTGQTMNMNMTGGGDGKLVYDIPANYGVGMTSNMNINYSMVLPQAPGMKMNGKLKMVMDYKTDISKN